LILHYLFSMNCDEFGDGLENDCVINREKDPVNSRVFGVDRRSNFSRKVKITITFYMKSCY
jgi:hypothetical protein